MFQAPATYSSELVFPQPLDTHQAAAEVGCAEYTLRVSRVTGTLFGKPAPKYRKLGRKVVYYREDLLAFLEQFDKQSNTSVDLVKERV